MDQETFFRLEPLPVSLFPHITIPWRERWFQVNMTRKVQWFLFAFIPEDGGVVMSTSGGDMCRSIQQARSMTAYLKCDPTVTDRPTTFTVSETNPHTGVVTPCQYWTSPIRYAGFCPNGFVTGSALGTIYSTQISTQGAAALQSVTAITTTPTPLLDAGLACAKINTGCSSSYPGKTKRDKKTFVFV